MVSTGTMALEESSSGIGEVPGVRYTSSGSDVERVLALGLVEWRVVSTWLGLVVVWWRVVSTWLVEFGGVGFLWLWLSMVVFYF